MMIATLSALSSLAAPVAGVEPSAPGRSLSMFAAGLQIGIAIAVWITLLALIASLRRPAATGRLAGLLVVHAAAFVLVTLWRTMIPAA